MLKYHRSDLFAAVDELSQLDFKGGVSPKIFIPHVCNNQGVMGAGFVVPLKRKWPLVEHMYKSMCDTGGNENPQCRLLGQVQAVKVESDVTVFNMIAQTLGGVRPLNYVSLARCIDTVFEHCWAQDQKTGNKPQIHAPMFGAGLAGGNWEFIKTLINDAWSHIDVHIYFLEGQAPDGFAIDKNGNQISSNCKLRGDGDEGVVKAIISDTQVKVDFFGDEMNGQERIIDPIHYEICD